MLRFAIVLSLISMPVAAGEFQPAPASPITAQEYADQVSRFDYAAHTIELSRFNELAGADDAVVLDLRSREAYEAGHYKGAHWLGADITAEKLAAIVPNKSSTILVYCQNSLMATRMISLTDIGLPQIHALGYANVFKLERIWDDGGHTRPEDMALFSSTSAD